MMREAISTLEAGRAHGGNERLSLDRLAVNPLAEAGDRMAARRRRGRVEQEGEVAHGRAPIG
jgi:hypothetical protein